MVTPTSSTLAEAMANPAPATLPPGFAVVGPGLWSIDDTGQATKLAASIGDYEHLRSLGTEPTEPP